VLGRRPRSTDDLSVLPPVEEKTQTVRTMFDAIAPRYERVNRIMTFGLDAGWRRRTVRSLGLPAGSVVLDLACGTGDLSRTAEASGLVPIGADLSFGMLAASHGVATLLQADATSLPLADGSIDGVLCGYALRNFTDLTESVAEMARVLRPGGRLSILEVGAPRSRLVRVGYDLWFRRCVPVIGGLLSDRAAYRYLPASTVYLPEPEELRALLLDAGFSGVNHRELSGGLSQLITATRARHR
jgi:demethylmenaquinone methyltransferase / 2-methoxy-6-polyprenyl-1,4-benzoquinol methylase